MKKKKIIITLVCIGVLFVIMGFSYAYWNITFTEKDNNTVTMDCFEIEFLEGDAIHLNRVYPVSDEEGLQNKPYTVTVKNVCEGRASYQINLETLIPSGKKLPDQYLKVNVVEDNITKITTKLESSLETETTIEGAVNAYQLLTGVLKENQTKTFQIKLWMHSEVTALDKDSMNAEYNGKIKIITGYLEPLPELADTIKKIPVVTSGNGLYEVSHSDANITYTSDSTAINNLKQTEYRFAGPNPNNYVNFNNEVWRVIGLVNTPEGQRIKLVRNASIGSYSWDSRSSSGPDEAWGANEWSVSRMKNLLNNGAYYNRTTGSCYTNYNNQTVSCDFTNTGLTNEAKSMIDTVTWNTGSNNKTTFKSDKLNTIDFYHLERSSNIGKVCDGWTSCTDTVARTTSWVGQVGLIYPSDYGYATSGGTTTNRDTCLNTILYNWASYSNCKDNNWLYKGKINVWTMMPTANYQSLNNSFAIASGSRMEWQLNAKALNIFPTIYLKANVKIENGNGSSSSPYYLSI